jgi:hypothetical protein
VLWPIDGTPRRFRVAPARATSRRHRRKYAAGDLGDEGSFYFRGADGRLNLRAQNLMLFTQIGDGVDTDTWEHHRRRGDYSTWVRTRIKDDELADAIAAVERDAALDTDAARARVREAVEHSYTLPARSPV